MAFQKLIFQVVPILLTLLTLLSCSSSAPLPSKLFTEYIGAEFKGTKLSNVPISPNVNFHFILSFAIDYTTSSSNPTPTNGHFNIFWDTDNLTPASVASIKQSHRNVRVALSLGGNSVGPIDAYFTPSSVGSWVGNAVSSLTKIINQYHLDGIDIDYEHFTGNPNIFAECIGQLVTTLKRNGVISFASIAPFNDDQVQSHYLALWSKYGQVIDYVNFQFYAYDSSTTVNQFLSYFKAQSVNYAGGKLLASFATDGTSGGLTPASGFFTACNRLKMQGKLHGIFIWSADDSMNNGFRYEKISQSILASAN